MSSPSIPYGCQTLSDVDVQAVTDALKSDWITQGPRVEAFERELATFAGARYAVAVTSGTAALHLAYLAAGISKGDRVLTSPNTFVATANAAVYCGGVPEFVDVDERTYNLDADCLQSRLDSGPPPKAIIPVHFAGQPCAMSQIAEMAEKSGVVVIEDACHAIGSSWIDDQGVTQKVGNCSHSDMAVFSFHPVKNITTGEGGAVLTNSEDLYRQLIRLRSHGLMKDSEKMHASHGPWYYEMHDLGFNYRITDIQCALGTSQLASLAVWVDRRRELASVYDTAFAGCDLITPYESPWARSSYHLYVVQTDDSVTRRALFETLRDAGIGVQVHYIPVHTQPYYRERFGTRDGDCPVAEAYYERCLTLPLFPMLTAVEQEYVISIVRTSLSRMT
jgi:perosamine synthetase